MAGLNANGFEPKTYTEIKTDINTKMKPTLGSGVETESDSNFALDRNAHSIEIAELWQITQTVYNQRGINNAEGVQLDNEASVVGIKRGSASYSTVPVEIEGSQGTIIAQFYPLQVSGTGEIFQTQEEITLPAEIDQPVTYQMRAVNTGPIACLEGDLTGTLPFGVSRMTNVVDAEVGQNAETDEEFRQSYPDKLAQIGGASIPAITAAIKNLTLVTSVFLRENVKDIVNSDGLPPHSFNPIVTGDDPDIGQTIFQKKSAGIETYGAIEDVIEYNSQTFKVYHDTATNVLIYIVVDITSVDDDFPSNGAEMIENNLLAYGDTLGAGDDVLKAKIVNAVTDVNGILDYTIKFDIVTPPVNENNNLPMSLAQKADFDSTNITVNVP